MKKLLMVFLMASSVILMACQIQYLIAGRPTPAPETQSRARSTATVKADSTVQAQPAGGSTPILVTANADLVVRATASTVAPSVGQLKKGDTVQMVARTPANDWFQVSIPAGLMFVQGWIPANQVTVGGDSLDQVPVVPAGAAPGSSSKSTIPTPARKTYP